MSLGDQRLPWILLPTWGKVALRSAGFVLIPWLYLTISIYLSTERGA